MYQMLICKVQIAIKLLFLVIFNMTKYSKSIHSGTLFTSVN